MDYDVPNFDAMDHSELVQFRATAANLGDRAAARQLFPDRPSGYVRTFRDLRAYAINKQTAFECRRRSDINAALIYERICDNIYDKLPAWAVW